MNSRIKVAGFSSNAKAVEASECPYKIPELPSEIIIHILSRLPIKTIFNCRRVCKDWLHLISLPSFVELQLARSPVDILMKTRPEERESRQVSLIHVEQSHWIDKPIDRIKFNPKNSLPVSNFDVVNLCNGLLCLSGLKRDDPLYVCNPILGEFITIPSTSKGRHWSGFVGLGYCALTGQYKVLQAFYRKIESDLRSKYLEAEVYTIGTGEWRSTGHAPNDLVTLPFNSFVHDSLHWVPLAGYSQEFIHSFSFENEKFGVVPEPSFFGSSEKMFSDILKIGVLDGCLFLYYFGDDPRNFETWIMNEYGIRDSWTKLYDIDNLYRTSRKVDNDVYEPVKFLDSGEILMVFNSWHVSCYDLKTQWLRCTRIARSQFDISVYAHTPSFVSLHSVGRENK